MELVGPWIGFCEDGEFARLELRANFTKYCAFVAPVKRILHKNGVDVYRVTRWTLQGWKLAVSLASFDPRNGGDYPEGRVGVHDLELQGGYRRKLQAEGRSQ